MTDLKRAFEAAAAACPFVNRDAIRRILEAAERAWPHDPPRRDPASTTGGTAVIRNTQDFYRRRDRAPHRPAPFGFGKDVTA